MPIQPTTCFEKIAALTKELRIIQGGTSAGKTYSILLYLIYYCLNPKLSLDISIVAESLPVLKRGAMKDFEDILKANNWYKEEDHNKTDRIYKIGNSSVQFFGAEDASKLRGARRDILFINECNNVSFDVFQELNIRTRMFTILDYNPTAPFWATQELAEQDNAELIVVTYKDNEFLEQKIIDDIESWEEKGLTNPYYANRWKVMGLGLIGQQMGAVYSDWSEIESVPLGAELVGSGMDFGFTNDPTTLISVYKYNNEIIVDEKIYQKGLLTKDLTSLIRNTDASHGLIYADSASPQNIAELKAQGFAVLPVFKGKDSINYGIGLIQEQHFKVTSRSVNLIKELQNYIWAIDREGNTLNVPIDDWNHGLDALRYLFLMKFNKKSQYFNLKWKR